MHVFQVQVLVVHVDFTREVAHLKSALLLEAAVSDGGIDVGRLHGK